MADSTDTNPGAHLGSFDRIAENRYARLLATAGPVVVLEAMAMARLVVATDVGGVTEQLTDGEHGFVVPPGDPEAIADRVLAVLDDPMRAESLGRAARERVVQRFSVEAIADRTQAVYRATFE
jgi:glycosyltransferase involved in cell wall biosynthesis